VSDSSSAGRVPRQHTSAYVSIRQHTSAYVSIRYSIRQHTSAYVTCREPRQLQPHHLELVGTRRSAEISEIPHHNREAVERNLRRRDSQLVEVNLKLAQRRPAAPRVSVSMRTFAPVN
jgi:hypothetical protein